MCGAMISLTPCIASKTTRDCDLDASVSFRTKADMIDHLNAILAIPRDFPQIPEPRKECHVFYAKPDERHKQMVVCSEQDCEWLVYMSDQDTCMVEALGVQDHPLWIAASPGVQGLAAEAQEEFQDLQGTMDMGGYQFLQVVHYFLPGDLPSVANLFLLISPSVQIQKHQVLHGEILMSSIPAWSSSFQALIFHAQWRRRSHCPQRVRKTTSIGLFKSFDFYHPTCKDPRVYCAYCDMNNHPRFCCKHVAKHKNQNERHRCTLCSAKHAPFQCSLAQVNGGPGKPNWYKAEYKRAKSENREPDYRWGPQVTHDDVKGADSIAQQPQEVPQPQCAAAAMMHGISMAPAESS